MPDLGLWAQLITNGLLSGGLLALVAMGLTLVFGVMDIVNVAHGTYVLLGMYAAHVLWAFAGIDPFVAIFIIAPAFFIFGLVSHVAVIKRVIDESIAAQVFATIGLLWIFQNFALAVFGSVPRNAGGDYGGFSLGRIVVQEARLYGFIVALFFTVLLYLFLYRTKTGLAIRATAQSPTLARPFGIDIDYIYLITFGIGIALAGVSGSVLIATRSVVPITANFLLLIAFVIVTLGGLGSITGALLGGLFIGVVDSFVSFYLAPPLGPPIYFAIFIGILILRSTGRIETIKYWLDQALPARIRGMRY
jgi:branched-chain amino acid transport system permease protein